MSEIIQRTDRPTPPDVATVASGWAALVFAILGLHRWVALGSLDMWGRVGLIGGFALAIWWAWGYWAEISTRVRAWRRGGGLNTALIALGLIASLILVNTLVRRRLAMKVDLTKNQRFTLSPRSRDIVKALKQPVHATVFIPAGRSTGKARDLFKLYGDASDKFTWTHVDPLTNLNQVLAKKPKLGQDLTGAYLEMGDKRQDVTEFTEKEVTGAILKLTRDSVRKIYFLEGHGEMSTAPTGAADTRKSLRALTEDLKGLQWQVEKLNLYGKTVKTPEPSDAAVVVIAGPEKDLFPEEAKRLTDYLNAGGHVLLFLNAGGPSYAPFLQPWGIHTANDVVLDRSQNQGLVLVDKAEDHPSVSQIRRVVFAPMHSVRPASPAPAGITVTPLIKTGAFTEVVSDFKGGADLKQPGKPEPAVPVAALAEKSIGTGDTAKKARVAVVGDATFAADVMAQFPVDNQALASGLINYLGEEEALVSIPQKDENTEQAFLTPDQGRMLLLIHFLDFPLLALLLAVIVYLKRR
jgi:ABC-type uncharacterized transport system involved in gliding motility auxiliary subunit